jgi:glutathione S-transferase
MIALYHFAGAICAQKVRVCLAEKELTWESRVISDSSAGLRSAAYLQLNPNGYVPTLLHDERVLTESRLINEYLDDAFAGPRLSPAAPFDRYRVAAWTKQIDDSLHLNIYVLSFVIVFRAGRLAMDAEALERSLPLTNPVKRAYTLQMIEHGFDSAPVRPALARFRALLDDMEAALARGEWLVGDAYTLADVDFTPYLARLETLGVWPLLAEHYPNVARWFAAVQARHSYRAGLLEWFTDADRAGARAKAEAARPHLAALLASP